MAYEADNLSGLWMLDAKHRPIRNKIHQYLGIKHRK